MRARVLTLDGISAHADREEMLRWLGGFRRPPARPYVVHGEPAAAESLATAIRTRLGWTVEVAADGADGRAVTRRSPPTGWTGQRDREDREVARRAA